MARSPSWRRSTTWTRLCNWPTIRPFGLQGALFTRDLRSAFRFSNEFDVGSLWVNEASRFRLDLYPFGGFKTSGVGREGVRYAIEEFSQIKFTGDSILICLVLCQIPI